MYRSRRFSDNSLFYFAIFFLILASMQLVSCSDDNDVVDGDLELDGDTDLTETETDLDGDIDLELDTSENTDSEEQTPRQAIADDVLPEQLVMNPQDEDPEIVLPDGVTIRVATYNIYGGQFSTAYEIGAFLATLDLDIVGLQEFPANFAEQMATAGGFPYYFDSNHAILSKHELINPETISLGGRSVAHANFIKDGVEFSYYNAHLSWNVAGDLECRDLVDLALSLDSTPHLIMTGDFNDEHYSSQITILEEVLTDAATNFGWYPGQRISWPSFGFDGSEGSQLIDLIFYKKDYPAIVTYADILNLSPILSDHKPAIAELLFPKDPQTAFTDADNPYTESRDIWYGFPDDDKLPENMIKNPGAEDSVTGWEIEGDGVSATEREQQSPHSGDSFFTGFLSNEEDTKYSSGSQTIDLTAHADAIDNLKARIYVSAYMTTGYKIVTGDAGTPGEGVVANSPRPYDDGEIIVELLDADQNILTRKTSSRRDTLKYHAYAEIIDLPKNTRYAKLTWFSHYKNQNGNSNDAIFDDIYMGFSELDTAHNLKYKNLVKNFGAESGDLAGWNTDSWIYLNDMVVYGVNGSPLLSQSGKGFFFVGGRIGLEEGPKGTSRLEQEIDLAEFANEIDKDQLAIRWGGWLRNYQGDAKVTLSLEILDLDGSLWGTISADIISAAEWTKTEQLTKLPAGCSAIRLVISSDVETTNTAAFLDEAFVVPEIVK